MERVAEKKNGRKTRNFPFGVTGRLARQPRPVTRVWPPVDPGRWMGPQPLPASYADNRVVLLARDPHWLFAYWDLDPARQEQINRQHGPGVWESSRLALQLYDLNLPDRGRPVQEVAVYGLTNSWYLGGAEPGHTYQAELGLVTPQGHFIALGRSNTTSTPRAGISDLVDEEWLTIEELYHFPAGQVRAEGSPAFAEAMAKHLEQFLASPGLVGPWPSHRS